MLTTLVGAFLLGNASILTNVCLLPLYPGMVAYLLGLAPQRPVAVGGANGHLATAAGPRASAPVSSAAGVRPLLGRWRAALLGLCVLAGVLVLMTAVAALLSLAKASFAGLLPVLLPLVYLSVIGFGVLLVLGRNPMARLPVFGARLPRRPYLAAFTYGLLLGPMTLPCTGPIVLSAFVLGLGSPGFLLEGLAYFAVFGLGFGWPLVLIPVLAAGANRRFGDWFVRRHELLTRLSGWMLVAIGVFGMLYEVAPNVL